MAFPMGWIPFIFRPMKTKRNNSITALKRHSHFAKLIKQYGMPDRKRRKNPFQALVRAIIHQQVSGASSSAILQRFVDLFHGKGFPTAEKVSETSTKKLRTAGLSPQKAAYIKDLAQKFSDGTIKYRSFQRMSNEEIIEHLLQVKGIGVWTCHMFLIFTLNRPDILPTGDLGIRKGFQIIYHLKNLPDHDKMEKLAKPWRKHASTASWYLWRAADGMKNTPKKQK